MGMDKKKRETQAKKVYASFYESPKTMKEVDAETGIMRENICRFCSDLRDQGRLYEVGERLCRITKHLATVYTTNPDLTPESSQTKLFEYGG